MIFQKDSAALVSRGIWRKETARSTDRTGSGRAMHGPEGGDLIRRNCREAVLRFDGPIHAADGLPG